MQKSVAAFSLIELLLVVVLLAVIAVVAIPRFGLDTLGGLAATTTTRKIASDMRLARSLAISRATTNSQGYAVRMTGAAPYSGYEIVNIMTGETVSTKIISSDVSCTGDSEFRFGPLGSLSPGYGTALLVSGQGKQYALTLTSATGSVTHQEQ